MIIRKKCVLNIEAEFDSPTSGGMGELGWWWPSGQAIVGGRPTTSPPTHTQYRKQRNEKQHSTMQGK